MHCDMLSLHTWHFRYISPKYKKVLKEGKFMTFNDDNNALTLCL